MQWMTACGAAIACAGVAAADVDVRLTPQAGVYELCEIVEIDLLVSSDDGNPRPFDALDAILSWDPDVLELVGVDDSGAGAVFFISDFLNDPDGVNDDITDGEALYTAWAPPGSPIDAPPDPAELVVTTIQFIARDTAAATVVSFLPTVGAFGETRVLFEGGNITGDVSDTAVVETGPCAADLNDNGAVDFADILVIIGAWGPCPVDCCPEDLNGNGQVDFADILVVIAEWGPCP
ncbi:MAG: hypothetical protein ACYTGP_08285 [Planctomycetota bacterium]